MIRMGERFPSKGAPWGDLGEVMELFPMLIVVVISGSMHSPKLLHQKVDFIVFKLEDKSLPPPPLALGGMQFWIEWEV